MPRMAQIFPRSKCDPAFPNETGPMVPNLAMARCMIQASQEMESLAKFVARVTPGAALALNGTP